MNTYALVFASENVQLLDNLELMMSPQYLSMQNDQLSWC